MLLVKMFKVPEHRFKKGSVTVLIKNHETNLKSTIRILTLTRYISDVAVVS